MTGFTLLWSKILHSSLWVKESKETRLVWITLLALKNSKGVIQSSVVGLADAAKVTTDECREALKVLLSPDPDDTSGVEEGRRIREVEGGWQIINNDKYRFSTEAKREFWRENKAEYRKRKNWQTTKNGQPLTIKEFVKKSVDNDPITKQDKAVMRKKWGKKDETEEPDTAIDYESPVDLQA